MPQSQSFPVTAFKNAAGYQSQGQLGKSLDVLVGDVVPTNYEVAYAGNAFIGANQAAVTTTVALATTYVGLVLSNPAGNTKNLVLINTAGEIEVAPSVITSFGLITGYSAAGITVHTTALTPTSSFINGTAPTAKLDSAATLVGTPVWSDWLGVTSGATTQLSFSKSYNGSIIIPPGGYVALGTSVAGPASGFRGSFTWLELAQ
jgi:hypothetical protein